MGRRCAALAAAAAPRVVASILPVQSLAATVMDGVSTPELIIHGAARRMPTRYGPAGRRGCSMPPRSCSGSARNTKASWPSRCAPLAGKARVDSAAESPRHRDLAGAQGRHVEPGRRAQSGCNTSRYRSACLPRSAKRDGHGAGDRRDVLSEVDPAHRDATPAMPSARSRG